MGLNLNAVMSVIGNVPAVVVATVGGTIIRSYTTRR